MQGKISPEEKEQVLGKVTEVEAWMGSNAEAETEEYEGKQKELEGIFNPIAAKLYQGEGGPGGPGGAGNPFAGQGGNPFAGQQPGGPQPGASSGPSVDEVD